MASRFCVIKNSAIIKNELEALWAKHRMLQIDVVQDAKSFGVSLDTASLSRYLKSFDSRGNVKDEAEARISQETLLWLCHRWGVKVEITISPEHLSGTVLRERAPKFEKKKYLRP